MSVESNFITKLIKTGDYDTVDEKQIKQKFFNGSFRRMFKFIQEFKTRYGKVPSETEFKKKFNLFTFEDDTQETMAYYCDEVRLKVKHNTIVDAVEEIQEAVNEDMDTEKAYSIFKQTVSKVENEVVLGETRKINEDTQKRLEAYYGRRDSGGITGMPTGIKPLDEMLGGLQPTDLMTIAGFTGTGKTWSEVIIGVGVAKIGFKVLFITREMGTDQLMKRVDAVYAGISYGDFNRGKLSPQQEAKLQEYYARVEGDESINFIVELATGGVANISSLVDKHDPDLVLIDGAYLLTDDEDDDDHRAVVRIWRAIKQNICLGKKKPVIVTSQIKDGEKTSLGKLAFAKALANECDQVIALEQDETMKADKEMKWKPLKLRDADMRSWFITCWDWDAMNYEPIYHEGKFATPNEEDLPETQEVEPKRMKIEKK